MPRVIIDMDEVMVDNYQVYHQIFEQKAGRPVDPAEYRGRRIYDMDGFADIRDALHQKGFFRKQPIMQDAQEVVRELYDKHEVWIVTAAMEFRHSFLDKYEWLEEHFPFIHYKRIVFCGDKSIVHGDYMIDDKVSNLASFNGTGLLFTASHNLDDTGYARVDNWRDVQDYFRTQAH
ncbi:MAG: 5'(3')-deoxyribonucleotidase [Bacteroidota bacterium]